MQKKLESRKMLGEQLEHIKMIEDRKKLLKLNDIEEEKIYREKFQNLMDNKDKERYDHHKKIQEKAKLIDIREKMIINQKNLQNFIENNIENKYKKEKEQIENMYFLK
jgi:hypothetical protein